MVLPNHCCSMCLCCMCVRTQNQIICEQQTPTPQLNTVKNIYRLHKMFASFFVKTRKWDSLKALIKRRKLQNWDNFEVCRADDTESLFIHAVAQQLNLDFTAPFTPVPVNVSSKFYDCTCNGGWLSWIECLFYWANWLTNSEFVS